MRNILPAEHARRDKSASMKDPNKDPLYAERVYVNRYKWVQFTEIVEREALKLPGPDFPHLVRKILVMHRHYSPDGTMDVTAEIFSDLVWQALCERLPPEKLPGYEQAQQQGETSEVAMCGVKTLRSDGGF